jgi:hypothetical protein
MARFGRRGRAAAGGQGGRGDSRARARFARFRGQAGTSVGDGPEQSAEVLAISTKCTRTRRSISQVLVLTALALAVGQAAHAQQPTVFARQVAAAEIVPEYPVWETHVALGPTRATAVFCLGHRLSGYARVGYAIYDVAADAWIVPGIIDDSAGFCADGSVVAYQRLVAEGGDEGEGDSGPGLVYGFVALLSRRVSWHRLARQPLHRRVQRHRPHGEPQQGQDDHLGDRGEFLGHSIRVRTRWHAWSCGCR